MAKRTKKAKTSRKTKPSDRTGIPKTVATVAKPGSIPPVWHDELGTSHTPALGFLELDSISRGLFLTDKILKKAPVRMIASQPISSGKHVVLFFGDVAAVEESFTEAVAFADSCLIKNILIPNVHEALIPFLDSIWSGKSSFVKNLTEDESVGIIESKSLAGAIISADAALKTASVDICRVRLGQGIGGKAYFVVNGIQEDVEASVEAAQAKLNELESLQRVDVIPRPSAESLAYF